MAGFSCLTSKCARMPSSAPAVRNVRFVLLLSFPVHSALLNSGVGWFTMRLFDWSKREGTHSMFILDCGLKHGMGGQYTKKRSAE